MSIISSISKLDNDWKDSDNIKHCSAFFEAIKDNNAATVKSWLEKGFDPNTNHLTLTGEIDKSPLMEAVIVKNCAIINDLLDCHADINSVDCFGNSALMFCVATSFVTPGRIDVLNLLIDRGADLSKQNSDGMTALHMACEAGSHKLVKLLLAANHEIIDLPNHQGRTPLITACLSGYDMCVKYLLDAGCNINHGDNHGQNSLMWAIQANKTYIVDKLLNRQTIDIDLTDQNGFTALMYAALYNRTLCASKLIDAEANMDLFNKDQHSALDIAAMRGNSEIAEYLAQQNKKKLENHLLDLNIDLVKNNESGSSLYF